MSAHIRVVDETDNMAPSLNWEALFGSAEDVLGASLDPLTVIFVSRKKGAELNERTRGKKGATNVLSFEDDREVVITPQVVAEEAASRGLSTEDWMQRLVVHGILHLEGYTHESDDNAAAMEALEQRILSDLRS